MGTFLFTVAVFSILIFAGCRFNLYLYAHGAFAGRARILRQVQSIEQKQLYVYEGETQGEDYGVRYARTGILLIIGVTALIAAGLIIAVLALLH